MVGRRYDGTIRFDKFAVAVTPTVATSECASEEPLIQESLSRANTDRRAIATPLPYRRLLTQTGPHRVVCDVTAGGQQVGVVADQLGHEPIAKQVRASPMRCVESLRVATVQLLHRSGKARVRSYYDQVVMVVHQAVRKAWKPITLDCQLKPFKKELAILVEAEDGPSVAPSRGDVVDAVGDESAERAAHFGSLELDSGRE